MFEEDPDEAARLGKAILDVLPRVTAMMKEWAAENDISRDNFAEMSASAVVAFLGQDNPLRPESVLDLVRELRTKAIHACALLMAADDPVVLGEAGPSLALVLQMLDQVEGSLQRLLAAGWHRRGDAPLLHSEEDRALAEDSLNFAAYLAVIGGW